MRHQKAGRKLNRTSSHRRAMFQNMLTSLLIHERVTTTEPKAKELKRLADRTISWGCSVNDLTARGRDKLDVAEKARVVHAMRMARRSVKSEEAVSKLFSEIAPRLRGRAGGYTRLLKLNPRLGDAAPMALVEIVERAAAKPKAEPKPAAAAAAPAEAEGKKAKAKTAKAKAK